MIYFCVKFQKDPLVWSEFNIFCTLVTMAMATILNLFNPSKAATLQSFMKFDERNPIFF
jgi:hypothetical protein